MIQISRFNRFTSALILAAIAAATPVLAEEGIQFPDASQRGSVKQRVGLTDVEVDYSRPNKNDRQIFGGLVPYGKLWRTGADAPTTIKFSKAVSIDGKDLPAGDYALFTIPTASEWTVIFSRDAKVQSAGDYKEENDAARVMVQPIRLTAPVETFTIGFADVKGASATLHLDWDTTRVAMKLTTNDIEEISKQLEAAANGSTQLDPRSMFQAASFYYDNGKDLNQALKWIDQAIAKNPDAYFMHMRRAQIEAKLGNKAEAIASAQKTIDILKAQKDPDEAAIRNAQQIIDAAK